MKPVLKALLCMATIFAALAFICLKCNGFAPATEGVHYSQQLTGLADWAPVFAVIAFFTGFLPAYIYESIKAMKPAPQMEGKVQVNSTPAEQEQEAPAPAAAPALYVGQIIAANGCYLRVKALKIAA